MSSRRPHPNFSGPMGIHVSVLFLEVLEDLSVWCTTLWSTWCGGTVQTPCVTSQPGQSCSTLLIARGGRSQLLMIFTFSTRLSQGKAGFPAPAALKQQVSDDDFIARFPSTLPHSLHFQSRQLFKGQPWSRDSPSLGKDMLLGWPHVSNWRTYSARPPLTPIWYLPGAQQRWIPSYCMKIINNGQKMSRNGQEKKTDTGTSLL